MVTVYTQPGCVQCGPMKRTLDRLGVEYVERDVTKDKGAEEEIRNLGYTSVPVVYASETLHWNGFRPDRVAELV